MSYSAEVGTRLRELRAQRGWSLHEVERRSDGRWKAAVIGSYERGDRNISAARLVELATFYDVDPTELLPGQPAPSAPLDRGPKLDLTRLAAVAPRFDGVTRYLATVQRQRGDYNQRVLSLRGDDLRALAAIESVDVADLVAALRDAGVLLEHDR